jgi:hypothetical protein
MSTTAGPSPDGGQRLAQAREALARAQAHRGELVMALAQARRTLAALRARHGDDDERTQAARRAYEASLDALRGARRAAGAAKIDVAGGLQASLPDGVGDEVARLTADVPIVLLPVRLETRFARVTPTRGSPERSGCASTPTASSARPTSRGCRSRSATRAATIGAGPGRMPASAAHGPRS